MRAQNCTRNTFDLGGETHNYSVLRRYVCDACGGRLVHQAVWSEEKDRSVDVVCCGRCGGIDIISESLYERQQAEAVEYRYNRKRGNMPLVDVVEQDTGRLTTLGRIRLGWTEPSQSGRDRAVQSDHFVFKDTPVLAQLFGEECKSLPVRFPFPEFDRNIVASYRVWAGGRDRSGGICLCEGDGAKVVSALPFKVSVDDKGNAHVNRAPGDRWVSWGKAVESLEWGEHRFKEGDVVPCPGFERNRYPHCEVCRPNILLNIEVRHDDLNVFGYWQVGTQSLNNYRHFLSVWDRLTKKPDGSRIPIPMNEVRFVLSIRPGSTLFQDNKSKMWSATEKFYLHLQLDPDLVKLLNSYRDQRFVAMLQGRVVDLPLLPAEAEELPFDEPPVEDAEYDEILAGDDPFLDESEEPEGPPQPVGQVGVPDGLVHKNFVELAVKHLPAYQNAGQVKGAMLALTNDSAWERSTEWSPREYWPQLQTHAQAPA